MKNNVKKGDEGHGKVIQLEELSWKQIEELDKKKTVFFIPISPLEEHGPHLPVGTDYLMARDAAKKAVKTLNKKKPDFTYVLFPAIPLGYSKMASCFPGTVSTHVKAVKAIVHDVCSSLARFGFQYVVICTFHMDLGHLKGIYAAIHKVMREYSIKVAEPTGPYFYSREVEKHEPKVGFDTKKEVHAGFRETSLMKYQYPYLVDGLYKNLQNIYIDLYSPRYLRKTFKDIGIKDGYIGSPAQADSDYGRWYFQEIVRIYVQAAVDLIEGKKLPTLPRQIKMIMRSMFWL
ncbi:MAG: creatininase family protein [Thermoplasmatales archaeon]|nr:MAG: creatininase family protein [Thermoplasmatales archaeon]